MTWRSLFAPGRRRRAREHKLALRDPRYRVEADRTAIVVRSGGRCEVRVDRDGQPYACQRPASAFYPILPGAKRAHYGIASRPEWILHVCASCAAELARGDLAVVQRGPADRIRFCPKAKEPRP